PAEELGLATQSDVKKLTGGVALASAMQNPDLVAGERFGIAVNGGFWEGGSAVAGDLEGVLGHNVFTRGDRIAVTGGAGVGFDEDGKTSVGGHVGGQITW